MVFMHIIFIIIPKIKFRITALLKKKKGGGNIIGYSLFIPRQ